MRRMIRGYSKSRNSVDSLVMSKNKRARNRCSVMMQTDIMINSMVNKNKIKQRNKDRMRYRKSS